MNEVLSRVKTILNNSHKVYKAIENEYKKYSFKSFNKELEEEIKQFIQIHNFDEYKPNIGVFGENSTGKSTFLNTILGSKDEFKMGLGETTDNVTVLYKKTKPILKENSINIVYKESNYKELELFNLFDIPGYGKKYSEDNLKHILKELDIVLWIVDPKAGLKKSDLEFLKTIPEFEGKIVVINNKIETILHEINTPKDILNDIKSIKKVFKESKLEDSLIGVLPYSSIKSLVAIIKKEKNELLEIRNSLRLVILYLAFINSFKRFSEKLLNEINSYTIDKNETLKLIYNKIDIISDDLEYILKDKVSFLDSLNPFTSKDDEARPYVNRKKDELNRAVSDILYKNRVNKYYKKVDTLIDTLQSYNIFSQSTLSLPRTSFKEVDFYINLDDLAWNSFLGDSFAEDVGYNFRRKAKLEFNKFIEKELIELLKTIQEHNKLINNLVRLHINNLEKELKAKVITLEKYLAYTIVLSFKSNDKN